MDRYRRGLVLFALIAAGGVLWACRPRTRVDELPAPRATLADAGRRLVRERPVEQVTALASRGSRLLAALEPGERDALGRGHIRFEVDRPVVVEVAASQRSVPFWLADQGFVPTGRSLDVGEQAWPLFRRTFDAGWTGLGVNALDRSADEHYVALVRAADGSALTIRSPEPERWRAVVAAEGISAALDASLPIRGLGPELSGALVLQVRRDERHATVLARGRVWKTHVPSGPAADQVAIAFGSDPTSTLTWTWRTVPDVGATTLRLAPAAAGGEAPADLRGVLVLRGESRLVETPSVLNDPAIRRHAVRAEGLKPGTRYAYALGDGSPGGWSPWRTVRTAPEHPASFSFLYLGDAQCGLEAWGRLLAAAHGRHPDAGFLLLAGDLVDRGNERTNWDHFFLRGGPVLERLPLLPCAGNHEYLDRGPWLYRSFFELPANGPPGVDPDLVYAFEYGSVFVAALDSTMAVSDRRSARLQAAWLDSALGRTRARWKLVMFHHPVYASHVSRTYPSLLEDWVPVFDRHRVDLVLQGHDHAYLRTYPMRAGRRVGGGGEGTTYVVAVSGEKFVPQDARDYTAVGFENLATYQTIDVDEAAGRLTLRAWDLPGREVDRLVLEKPARLARH
jgi:hypothetical protein